MLIRPLLHLRLSSLSPCPSKGVDSPLFLDSSCHRLEEIVVSLGVHLTGGTHVRPRWSIHTSCFENLAVRFTFKREILDLIPTSREHVLPE
jgi:hypothetical protein